MKTPATGTVKAKKARLYQEVEFLTEVRPFRNYRNLKSLEKVCDYFRSDFFKMGFKPEMDAGRQ